VFPLWKKHQSINQSINHLISRIVQCTVRFKTFTNRHPSWCSKAHSALTTLIVHASLCLQNQLPQSSLTLSVSCKFTQLILHNNFFYVYIWLGANGGQVSEWGSWRSLPPTIEKAESLIIDVKILCVRCPHLNLRPLSWDKVELLEAMTMI